MPDVVPPQGREAEPVPLGQRLFDNIFLLLFGGVAVVALLYTAWGLYEVMTLPPATLP
jgi:hypothetical protein